MTSEFETYSENTNIDQAQPNRKTPIIESDLDSILDVPITISAVPGRTRLSVSEILKLSEGSILDLEKAIGEPVDVYINEKQIARGELMLVDDELSISITEIIDVNS